MKLEKTASGGQSLKITRKEWTRIGAAAGWIREAECPVAALAEKHGVDPLVIKEELAAGEKVESEHRDVYDFFRDALKEQGVEMPIGEKEFFRRIALAHLDEMPDYYTRLKKMEEA